MAPDQGFSQTPDGAHSREPSEFSSKPTQHLRNLAVFIATPDSSLQSCCIVKDLSLSESDDDNEIMKGIDWKKFLDLIETDMKIRPKLGQIKGSISSPPQTCDNLRHLRAIISLAYAECLSRITFVVTLDIARPGKQKISPYNDIDRINERLQKLIRSLLLCSQQSPFQSGRTISPHRRSIIRERSRYYTGEASRIARTYATSARRRGHEKKNSSSGMVLNQTFTGICIHLPVTTQEILKIPPYLRVLRADLPRQK